MLYNCITVQLCWNGSGDRPAAGYSLWGQRSHRNISWSVCLLNSSKELLCIRHTVEYSPKCIFHFEVLHCTKFTFSCFLQYFFMHKLIYDTWSCTANEGPERIQYKCISRTVRPRLFPKQNYKVLSPNFHIHVSVSETYIPRICLPI